MNTILNRCAIPFLALIAVSTSGCETPLHGDSREFIASQPKGASGASSAVQEAQKRAAVPYSPSGASSTKPVVPPSIQYPGASQNPGAPTNFAIGVPVELKAKVSRAAAEIRIEPDLPAGLDLDPATGLITGIPRQLAEAQTYTVTMTAGDHQATTTICFAVTADPKTIPGYKIKALVLVKGAPMLELAPAVAGPTGSKYSIEPAAELPAGLRLDAETGKLSGTPTGSRQASDFTFTITPRSGAAPTTESVSLSVGTVDAVAAGRGFACALLSGEEISCWGETDDASAAQHLLTSDGAAAMADSIAVSGSRVCGVTGDAHNVTCWTTPNKPYSPPSPNGRGLLAAVKQVAVGTSHVCATVDFGDVVCFGHNGEGQLGVAHTDSLTTPVTAQLKTHASAIFAGGNHSCAVLLDKTVRCWGQSFDSGDRKPYPVPSQIADLTDVASLAIGRAHGCAVTTDGSVKCWGRGELGQLGNGLSGAGGSSLKAVAVLGLAGRAKAVAVGDAFSCALLSDEKVQCWGDARNGHLGWRATDVCSTADGKKIACALKPGFVEGLPGSATSLAAGSENACVTSKGNAHCWGARFGTAPRPTGPWN